MHRERLPLPTAERLLSIRSDTSVTVSSAGTHALRGAPLDEPMARLLAARGLEASTHTGRQLTAAMIEQADLVLTMSRAQRAAVVTLVPQAVRRTYTLLELAALLSAVDLPVDPDETDADRIARLPEIASAQRVGRSPRARPRHPGPARPLRAGLPAGVRRSTPRSRRSPASCTRPQPGASVVPTLTERGARAPPFPGAGDGTDPTGRGGSSSPARRPAELAPALTARQRADDVPTVAAALTSPSTTASMSWRAHRGPPRLAADGRRCAPSSGTARGSRGSRA